jgi:hypothetical protein
MENENNIYCPGCMNDFPLAADMIREEPEPDHPSMGREVVSCPFCQTVIVL